MSGEREVVDIMAALEESIAAAKDARRRREVDRAAGVQPSPAQNEERER